MTNLPEYITEAQKAQFEAMMSMGQKTFEGVERLLNLNLTHLKAAVEESSETIKQMSAVKDVQEFVNFANGVAQPAGEKALAYSRQVYEITSNTSAEIAKMVESQIADANKKMVVALDNVSKNAPAGSESAVAMLKSAVTAMNSAYDSVSKATKQAVEMAEQNINAAANASMKAAAAAPRATARKTAA